MKYTTAQREGILNGLSPWKSDYGHYSAEDGDPYDAIRWTVIDAEGALSAIVFGGEEMAEFFAAELNRLASVVEQTE